LKVRFVILWASLFVAALLWFYLGTGFQRGAMNWCGVGQPDITGVWSFDLTGNVSTEVTITETHIDFMGQKSGYEAHYEGSFIVVTSPIPEGSSVPTDLSKDVLFLIKKKGNRMKVVAVGLATDVVFVKKEIVLESP
jgi:hypothetical protein